MSALQAIRRAIRHQLRNFGYDIVRFEPASHSLARRRKLLQISGTELVLDVGANTGQFAHELRSIGYGILDRWFRTGKVNQTKLLHPFLPHRLPQSTHQTLVIGQIVLRQ